LYHVPDVPRALAEFHRVLTPGGRCYAATFSHGNMREFNDAVERILGRRVSNSAAHFGLESGLPPMQGAFAQVEVIKYPDSMVVTEVEPLIDYVKSTRMHRLVSDDKIEALRNFFAHEIVAHQGFRISKDAGIFVAQK
ncbi:MAG TPA: methyltransferase domain-containing protein, partial [Candidatus Binataceae bacterium]|nr:methyltransferase domain-containing protein [Candidatus Binataceae bacterium]